MKNFKNNSSEVDILFSLKFRRIQDIETWEEQNKTYEELDLITKLPLTNMNAFVNNDGKREIKNFKTAEDILDHFYQERLSLYHQRK